jgi:hypothetical protein
LPPRRRQKGNLSRKKPQGSPGVSRGFLTQRNLLYDEIWWQGLVGGAIIKKNLAAIDKKITALFFKEPL